jgi:hypothetical protein
MVVPLWIWITGIAIGVLFVGSMFTGWILRKLKWVFLLLLFIVASIGVYYWLF